MLQGETKFKVGDIIIYAKPGQYNGTPKSQTILKIGKDLEGRMCYIFKFFPDGVTPRSILPIIAATDWILLDPLLEQIEQIKKEIYA